MSSLCLDQVAEARRILRRKIKPESRSPQKDLRIAARYLLHHTTYTERQAEQRLMSAASGFFKGMPEEYVRDSIIKVMQSAKRDGPFEESEITPQQITIYREELEKIEELGHDDTERLAFIFLCAAKMTPYKNSYIKNSEIYKAAWMYRYNRKTKTVAERADTKRVYGKDPTKRVKLICQSGIVRYHTHINTTHQRGNKPTASLSFSVPIKRGDGEVAFVIEKPDKESLVLYYDRYKGYKGIIDCESCGKPTFRGAPRQRYCASCAELFKHNPEKRNYGK